MRWHQRDIAKAESFLGCHPRYEADIGLRNPTQTTLRRVRQAINDLRNIFHVPILSESSAQGGYWIPKKSIEVEENMFGMQKKSIAQAHAYLKTYKEMRRTFGGSYRSAFFDELEGWIKRHNKNGNGDKE